MKFFCFLIVLLAIRRVYQLHRYLSNEQKDTVSDVPIAKNVTLYEKKELLTKAEYQFWKILKEKCDPLELIICPKVRMEDFIYVKSADFKIRQKHRGYIKARHIDFLLCDKELKIVAAIELDDNSHNKERAKLADELKNSIFVSINIPLYRIPVRSKYYEQEIDKVIKKISMGDTSYISKL